MAVNPLSSKGVGVWICVIYILRLKIIFILILYHDFNSWRRKWQPTPVFLPGKSYGWRSLVGYSPWGRKESDMTERLHSLTVRPETIKLLEENRGKTLYDINHSKILYDPPPPVMEIKTNKWDLIKLKSFCTTKETINKVKRQPTEWENSK